MGAIMAIGKSLRQGISLAWRSVLSGVSRGLSAFGIGQAASAAGQAIGMATSPISTQVVDQLSGFAGGWQQAAESFAQASPESAIDSSMTAWAPWSADLNTFNANPNYHVILGLDVAGIEGTVYRTVTGISDLSMTKADFMDLMDINAQGMTVGTTPGGGVGGVVNGITSVLITVGPAGG